MSCEDALGAHLAACDRLLREAATFSRRNMMNNPFDDENGSFHALVNSEGQYSLWPSFAPVPPGWTQAFGVGTRAECLDFIERSWADLRPAAVREPMAGAS